jgi:uncharacterized protein (UPF0333 family)
MTKKKHYFTPAFWRARKQCEPSQYDTPIKRSTSISAGVDILKITTPYKSSKYHELRKQKLLDDIKQIKKLKIRYLPANEEINCAFLHDKLTTEEIRILNETVIPESILSEVFTKEAIYDKRKSHKVTRKSANQVRRRTAKEAMQDIVSIINDCAEFENKETFCKFIRLYNAKDLKNSVVPSAEWCHMIALSLSADQQSAMSEDNLFAATAMVNTKMINFEAAAKRLYTHDKYTVKVETSFVTFKNSHVLARLTQRLTVTDTKGKTQTFEQTINPFEITAITQSNAINDPLSVYSFIKDSMLQHGVKQKARQRSKSKIVESQVDSSFEKSCKKLKFSE